MNIITLTMNPAVDIAIQIDQFTPGPKLRSKNPSYEAGGGGINVARVIQELGGQPLAVYLAGGSTGKMLEQLLKTKNIEQRCIEIKNRTRENITIKEKTSGQLYRVVIPGPEITKQEQKECLETLHNLSCIPDYMVISGSLPRGITSDFYCQIIREMKKVGTKVILDTKAETLKKVAKEGVFLIKPNLRELSELAGQQLKDEKLQEQEAMELISRGITETVVLSLGAAGVILTSNNINERIRAPSVQIKSRIGAGDSMVAGITLALSKGLTLREAVRYGVAAGSAAVKTPGTQLCYRKDVENLFSQLP